MSNQCIDVTKKRTLFGGNLKYILGFVIFILLMVAGIYWKKISTKPAVSYSQWNKPVPVRITPVQRNDLDIEIKAIGTVVPAHIVNVQSQVSGVLQRLYFKEGQWVKKGQLLAQIDPAAFEVALAQAEGLRQQNLAQLHHAQTELLRYQLLFKQDSIAKQQVEQQQALVNQLKGQMQSHRAQVHAAKLQLSYTKIYSPIDGRVGFKQKDTGNLLQANESTGLVTITQVHPIYVQFAVAEHHLMGLRESLTSNHQLQASAWDKAEQKQLAIGHIQALDNQIDLSTGTVKLKAVFDNRDDRLFPNQFVNIRLSSQIIKNAVNIPSDAVQHGAKGSYVYIINKNNRAELKTVKLGLSSKGQVEVLDGLNGTEKVVLEGIDRLSEGKEVNIISDQQSSRFVTESAAG
ncbi:MULTISPECIES: efflux RND transporter periplasmic adaptor subunit [unclassified Acinetobacter]|uniref:efflux RND transporter periplasmic adaptor subunit n=1 Tax=unclassified Acinetobacter TaxID=196816 RepID=UPI002934D58B|nr:MULTISPECIES: efflux RND transporter periplasmic adaptor subunit [unclassified Acinetobacter]WOE31510.1 efflux RND transporter periplasmic adaptor subunit [Acinetobacter sp. SAAs470]WOE39706.1 efflux RND transporter periplasmic adaptor subunit [Acinetobacter sp. SAAs474]